MNTVLGARGFASSSKQIGAWRPVTGRVWDGNAGRALPVDPSDQTQIDHDTRQDGGRRRRYVSNIPAAWTDPRGPYPWLVVRKDPQLLVDGQCRSDEPDQPPCTACTNCARMYCDLCSNRTTSVLPQQRLPQVHEAVPRRACGPLPQARGGIAQRASTTFGGAVEDQDETALHPAHSAVSCEAAHCASQVAVRCEARAQLRIHDLC